MSRGTAKARTQELTLKEEILTLTKYKVPQVVIDCMLEKLKECGEAEKRRIKYRDTYIGILQEENNRKNAVINALGAYLIIQEEMNREV